MIPEIIQRPGFDVVGIDIRTNNAKEMSGQSSIAALWARFMNEDIAGKIPNREGKAIYALYTGYANDGDGDYDYIIGIRVDATTAIPPGMVSKHVPAGKYISIPTEHGPVYEVVPTAWQRVWQMEDSSQLGGERAYAQTMKSTTSARRIHNWRRSSSTSV